MTHLVCSLRTKGKVWEPQRSLSVMVRKRSFSGGNNSDDSRRSSYIDQWFRSIVKPQAFYDEHANAAPVRRYFYNIDLQGRLFLEETLPKNIATSIKDIKFLNFFFRQIRQTTPRDVAMLDASIGENYPYVSPCGKELNFIRPAAKPIVFHALVDNELVYGGSLVQPLDYSLLRVSRSTGRLYHQLVSSKSTNKTQKTVLHDQTSPPNFGLIRSSVAVSLSERIVDSSDDEGHEMEIITPEGRCPLNWLPVDAEPGSWALPFDGD